MTILVTGIAGFIGSNFATQFKEKFPESEIVGIDDFSSGQRGSLPK
ncbi:MAG: NAD-dependent epimerase/dehydratase family protein, partial [Parcubacteria group bacterium]